MNEYTDFTFWQIEDSEDWDIDQLATEGTTANIPLNIETISCNMSGFGVSKRWNYKENSIKFNECASKQSWNTDFHKIKKTMSTSTVSSAKASLKEEISWLLRACASVQKNNFSFDFKDNMMNGNYSMKSKFFNNEQEYNPKNDSVTMKDIPALNE